MTALERLSKVDGFFVMNNSYPEHITYEHNDPWNEETDKNQKAVNAIYVVEDTKFITLNYWEPQYFLDGDGNNVFDVYKRQEYNYLKRNDNGRQMSGLETQDGVVRAGTWLFSPIGTPFTYIRLNSESEAPNEIICY